MKINKLAFKAIKDVDFEAFQDIVENSEELDLSDYHDISKFLQEEVENGHKNLQRFATCIGEYISELMDVDDSIDGYNELEEQELNNMDSVSIHMKNIRQYDLLSAKEEIDYTTEYQKYAKLQKKLKQRELLVKKIQSFVDAYVEKHSEYPIVESQRGVLNLYGEPLIIDSTILEKELNIKNQENFYIYNDKVYDDIPFEYVTNLLYDYKIEHRIPCIKGTNEINFKSLIKKEVMKEKPINIYLYIDKEIILLDEYRIQDKIEDLREKIVNSNLRLVISIAKRLTGNGLPMEDLTQEGSMGLMKAVEKFNPKLGYRFSTYATWWIKQSIRRGIADHGRTIRLPVHRHEQIGKIDKISRKLAEELNREPSLEELSEIVEKELGITRKKLASLLNNLHRTRSIDQTVSDDNNNSIKDYISDEENHSPERNTMNMELKTKLIFLFNTILDDRERTILILRNGIHSSENEEKEYTLQEIGYILGLTRERVRQIEIKALKKLRHPVCQKYLSGFHSFKANKAEPEDDNNDNDFLLTSYA